MFDGLAYLVGLYDSPVERNMEFTTSDYNNKNIEYRLNVVMDTKTFSANVPIDVRVTASVLNGSMPKSIYIIFPPSHILPHQPNGFGESLNGGVVNATLRTDGYYHGNAQIEYEMEGCYLLHATSVKPSLVNMSVNQTPVCSTISITSSDVANTLRSNTINTGLSYIIVAVSVLALRPVVLEIMKGSNNST